MVLEGLVFPYSKIHNPQSKMTKAAAFQSLSSNQKSALQNPNWIKSPISLRSEDHVLL
jgi:hypothetical protein